MHLCLKRIDFEMEVLFLVFLFSVSASFPTDIVLPEGNFYIPNESTHAGSSVTYIDPANNYAETLSTITQPIPIAFGVHPPLSIDETQANLPFITYTGQFSSYDIHTEPQPSNLDTSKITALQGMVEKTDEIIQNEVNFRESLINMINDLNETSS